MKLGALAVLLLACGGRELAEPVVCVIPDAAPVTCEAQDFFVFTPASVDDGGSAHSTGSQCAIVGCPHGDTCEARVGAVFVVGTCE